MTVHTALGRRRTDRRHLVLFAALLAVPFVFALAAWPPPAASAAGREPTIDGEPATAAPTAAVAPTTVAPIPPPERVPVPTPAPEPLPTFEEQVEQLVTIGRHTAECAQADDIENAQASDREARALLSALLQRFHDAGERALAMLAGMPEPTVDERDHSRRVVLQLVLMAELARRDELAIANDDRSRIDPLVESLLGVMPQAAGTTEVGVHLLDGRPYLRLPHERTVLGLVQLAGEGNFPRQAATRLLATLWDNLQRNGDRSSDELSRLAMLLLADGEATQRIVACRQLIADPRFRAMALAWLREHGDIAVATDIAGMAASELAPHDALQVLRELAPMLPRATGAYLVLGHRAPELVAAAYRELLAANMQPDIRTDLIAGIGLTRSEPAREVVELALHNDPSPEVRIQCAFVLTAAGDADAGERALQLLLDDPAIAGDPTRLGAIVLALQNLEAAGATNQIDRLAQRLRTLPLPAASRQALDALLARSLPAGQVSSPAPGSPVVPR